MTHLEKRGLIDVADTTVVSDVRCRVCRKCKSEVLSCGRGGRIPKARGEVVYTDLFQADVTDMKDFQVFVDKTSRDENVVALKMREAATYATGAYIDAVAREEVAIKCIRAGGAGELERSVKNSRHADQSRHPVALLTAKGIATYWDC